MASEHEINTKEEFEDGDGIVTPSPISAGVNGTTAGSQTEPTPVAGTPPPSGWAGSSTNSTAIAQTNSNDLSELKDISLASMKRAATPPPSHPRPSRYPDYFDLPLHKTGSPPFGKPPSRATSVKKSSSSLHTLAEHYESSPPRSLRKAPSNLSNWSDGIGRRPSRSKSPSISFAPVKSPNSEHPVYPDQSFASLQNQFYAGRPAPILRTRSSNPSPNLLYNDMSAQRSSQTHPNPSPAPMTAGNTPISSPGLFSPTSSRPLPLSDRYGGDLSRLGSPLLHPAHTQKPKVTHTAEIDRDMFTGNKYINEYEILGELGRGEHGKVKLGRKLGEETNVAIKIVPRFSKKRRLGKIGAQEDETKKEVAVLKKARHPNLVSLLEVIDDPGKNKVYLVLEFVERGEIQWRKKAPFEILGINNTRMDQTKEGQTLSLEPTEFQALAVKTARQRHLQRLERSSAAVMASVPKWSLEHSADTDDESEAGDLSRMISRQYSRSNVPSQALPHDDYSLSAESQLSGSMYGAYDTHAYRQRAASVAGSIASHMSSEFEFNLDLDMDRYGYVPALTFEECRNAIRDTLLGLEFLHILNIIHRDIKPANLLVAANTHIKISDFGVSYLGRPVSDEEEFKAIEAEAETLDDPKELAKSVGTPGFWAPEMCYDVRDENQVKIFENDGQPKIGRAIDLWSLGITLYGMVYARLPFYETREPWESLYDVIAKREPFFPRTRLVPVDTTNSDPVVSTKGPINSNKRLDYELKFEIVPDSLIDFIKGLLNKNPDKRTTVAQAKQHPWILEGIADPSQWLQKIDKRKQETDTQRILEPDERELSHAVVKRSIIERAVSGVTRMAGNLLGRRDARKRARSTATSTSASSDSIASRSASSGSTVGKTDLIKDGRRKSLRGDEIVVAALKASREGPEHPLAQSQTASPDEQEMPSYFSDMTRMKSASAGATPGYDQERRPPGPERAISAVSTAESVKTIRASQYTKRLSVLDPAPQEHQTETSNLLDAASTSLHGLFTGARKGLAGMKSRDRREQGGHQSPYISRQSSESDAHAEPSVAMSSASATGDFEVPAALRDDKPALHVSPISPSGDRRASLYVPPESSEMAFEQAQAINMRRYLQEAQEAEKAASRPESQVDHYEAECPPSPDDVVYLQKAQATAPEVFPTAQMVTLPSASTIASSEDFGNSSVSQSISNRSIGAISGASSPPNDLYLLGGKEHAAGHGSDTLPDFMRTSDTITAHGRPVIASGKPLEEQAEYDDGDNEADYGHDDDDDDDSGDDGILMMGPSSRKG